VGQTFFVETQDYASITNVNSIRLSSVTHTKNMNQRINRLAFDRDAGLGGLNVTAPASGNWSYPRSVDGLRLGIQAVHCGSWGFSVGHILLS
jgi:hypothetical protein